MRKSRLFVTALLLPLLWSTQCLAAETRKFPPRFQAVIDYLLQSEYPELIDDKPYKIRPIGYDIGDLDGDGIDEVVVAFYPHYRQSPTVVIFRVDDNMQVTRMKEGFAPGPLIPISGEYLDSHTFGHGVDMSLENGDMQDPRARMDFVKISMQHMGNVVAYRNFLHMDGREGKGSFIDMQHIKNPPKDKTCKSFQFSRVEKVRIGRKAGEKTGSVIALVGNEVYIYKINRFRPDGLIDKSVKVVPLKPKQGEKHEGGE